MRSEKVPKSYLAMRVPLSGRLNSKAALRKILLLYPALEQVSDGTDLRYVIKSETPNNYFHMAEFSNVGIAVETYSESSPLLLMRETLIRLLSLASFVKPCYEFRIESIFPYLIETLTRQNFEQYPINAAPERPGSMPEVVLSRRILSLKDELEKLKASNSANSGNVKRLAAALIATKYASRSSITQVATELGLEKLVIKQVLEKCDTQGMNVIWHSGDLFSLVSI